MSFNFRKTVHTSDLIEKLNGRLLTNTLVDTNAVGKRKVQVSYYNDYGVLENKYIEIEIK